MGGGGMGLSKMSTDAYRGKGYQARSVLTHLHYLFFMILTACLSYGALYYL